jgi:hypothetical protein
MQIKRLIKYYILGESLKEIEMNRILEKISKKGKLTKRENDFLNLYNETTDEERGRDLMYLSKNVAVKNGMVSEKDLELFRIVDTAEEARDKIVEYHNKYKTNETNF